MPTIRDFMSDIKATLGLGIDDAEWSDGALAYNVGLNIDLLKKQYLDRRMSRGDDRSVSQEISTFLLPIADETETGRRYFTMPAPVFELAHGGGIAFISYVRTDLPVNCAPQVARVQYSPTTWQELMLIEVDPIQRPSKPRPRYIRGSRQRTYLFGQDADIQTLEVGLYLPPAYRGGHRPGHPTASTPDRAAPSYDPAARELAHATAAGALAQRRPGQQCRGARSTSTATDQRQRPFTDHR
jgi:hypothetical protein